MKTYTKEWFKNKKVLILGMAKSGMTAARILCSLGADVTVNDSRQASQITPDEWSILQKCGVKTVFGSHPLSLIQAGKVDLLVKNPGIPYRLPLIQHALSLGIPVVTEIELGWHWTTSPIIGITGSNGKTTTTTLVGNMFKAACKKVQVVGNIGTVMSEAALTSGNDETLVVELSSFQLKGTVDFCPKVAALLNIYPAHLDYHETMEDYIQSKRKLFSNQTPDEIAIFNWEQDTCRQIADQCHSRVWKFSTQRAVQPGVYVYQDQIWMAVSQAPPKPLLPLSEIALKGSHNLENILAAVAIALACQLPIEAIRHVLRTFKGVAHRLEFVREVNGVRYYNDSKATNSHAARQALSTFHEGVTWIAGGLDRGNDFDDLIQVVKKHVQRLVAYGQTAEKMAAMCIKAGIEEIYKADDVEHAVILASEHTPPGGVVLLSPACASWDMYTSFEQRGDIFKQAVHKL